MATPDEMALWAREMNNACVPGVGSEIATFSEAKHVMEGMHEAFRQLIMELFMLHDMPADDWFDPTDPVRRHWSAQIRMAYEEWIKDKS